MPDPLRATFIAWAAQRFPGMRVTNQDFEIWLAGVEHGAQSGRPNFMDPPGTRVQGPPDRT